MADELWCFPTGFFRDDDPCDEVNEETGSQGEERERNPDQADDGGVGIIVFSDTGTDSPDHTTLFRAEQLFHVQECALAGIKPHYGSPRSWAEAYFPRKPRVIRRNGMTGTDQTTGLATFGAGCFWGVEEAFRTVDGVVGTAAGYMGGFVRDPGYEQVCTGGTGHAEVVQVTYDPAAITYAQLLDIFWSVHDPTQLNRQGPDIGPNYRSVIFYHTPEQRAIARKSKADIETSGRFGFGKIVTLIQPAGPFYPAEKEHQRYFAKRGGGICRR